MAEYAAQGTLLQYGDGGAPEAFSSVSHVKSITGPAISNAVVEVTALDDLGKEYISSGLYHGGEVTFTMVFDPLEGSNQLSLAVRDSDTILNWALCWPNFAENELAFAVGDVNVTPADTITENAHGLHTGQPIRFSSDGTPEDLPDPLVSNVTYYVIWVDANTYAVAATNALAIAGTKITLTDAGTGNHSAWHGDKYLFAGNALSCTPSGAVGGAIEGSMTLNVTGTLTL